MSTHETNEHGRIQEPEQPSGANRSELHTQRQPAIAKTVRASADARKPERHELVLANKSLKAGLRALKLVAARLSEREAQTRAVLDATVDAIIATDAYGRIQIFNAAAERIFGFSADEVVGECVSILMPMPYYEDHRKLLRHYRAAMRSTRHRTWLELTGLRKDGIKFPVRVALTKTHIGKHHWFTGVVRDLTEEKRQRRDIDAALRNRDSQIRNVLESASTHQSSVVNAELDEPVSAGSGDLTRCAMEAIGNAVKRQRSQQLLAPHGPRRGVARRNR